MIQQPSNARRPPDSLADVLERVLDKGVVIAGDIVINVLDIELLSLKLRLFISSAQTAKEMGMDWWTRDPFFTSPDRERVEDGDRQAVGNGDRKAIEGDALRERVRVLEELVRQQGKALQDRDEVDR